MKKIISLLIAFSFLITTFCACSKEQSLAPYVSELRSAIYYGESPNLSLRAGYGFKEQPFTNDGKVGKTISALTFKLYDKETDDVTYNLSFHYLESEYKSTFNLNPVTDTLTCTIEIDNFNKREFTVKIVYGSNTEEITLKSLVPENTLTFEKALSSLQKNQPTLISHYTDTEGDFNAEIYVRILVKEDRPYWYVGLASGKNSLKALLIDGFSGEILAIREIF